MEQLIAMVRVRHLDLLASTLSIYEKQSRCIEIDFLQVSKTAEECCTLIAGSQPTKEIFSILCPLIERGEFPSNLAAIKMVHTVC